MKRSRLGAGSLCTALLLPWLLATAGGLRAQSLEEGIGWVPLADGVWERSDGDGLRVERLALDEAGLRWALAELEDEDDRLVDLLGENHVGGVSESPLTRGVDRLGWALEALEVLAAEDGEAEIAAALARARAECGFTFDAETATAAGLPANWVYPFGLRGRGMASWQTDCGAEALVFVRVLTEATGPGFSLDPARRVDLCVTRGTGVGCQAQAQVTGFAPCRATVRAGIVSPELGFYFEVAETSTRCTANATFPDPGGY